LKQLQTSDCPVRPYSPESNCRDKTMVQFKTRIDSVITVTTNNYLALKQWVIDIVTFTSRTRYGLRESTPEYLFE